MKRRGSILSAFTSKEIVPRFLENQDISGDKSLVFDWKISYKISHFANFPRFVPSCVQIPKNLGSISLKVEGLSILTLGPSVQAQTISSSPCASSSLPFRQPFASAVYPQIYDPSPSNKTFVCLSLRLPFFIIDESLFLSFILSFFLSFFFLSLSLSLSICLCLFVCLSITVSYGIY